MACCNNCSKLWRVWYILLIFAFNVYLIYSAILRYLNFKSQVFNQRYGLNWSHAPLNFYLGMIIMALTCLFFMLYAGVARVGNHANDNVVIGRDPSTLKSALNEMTGRSEGSGSAWRRFRRHFLPLYGFLHVCAAFCLLIPLPLLSAERIRNEVLTKNRVWHSDLDFIYQPDKQHTKYTNKGTLVETLPITPEMVNLAIGLVHLTVRYPSTFWYSNRWFSLLFSCLVFTASFHLVIQHGAISVLFKLHYNDMPESKMGLSSVALLCLHSIAFLIIICSQYTIFEYGYTQFLDNLRKYRQYFVTASDSSDDVMSELGPSASSTTVASGTVNRNKTSSHRRRMACLQKYMPHILAAIFTCNALAIQGPLVWDCLRVYRINNDSLCLSVVIVSVTHLCIWVAAWFCFALKPSWHFQINIPIQTVSEITHGKMTSSTGPGVGSVDTNALYACFHDNPALSNSPNNTRPPSIDCCSDSSKTSSHGNRHNYVFLQSACLPPPPHIPTISEHVTNTDPSGNSSQSQMTFDSRMAPPPPPPPPPLMTSSCGTTAEQRAGLLKYAVQRSGSIRSVSALGSAGSSSNCVDSAGSISMIPSTVMGASLTRNSKLRKSYNRVTFKEHHAAIPGSPQSESTNNTMSSDSGIDSHHRLAMARNLGPSSMPPTAHNYEDYQLLGNLFKEPTYYNQSDFVNYVDVYGPSGGPPPPPPPPASMCEPDRVPDILQSQHSTTPSSGIRLGMAAVAGGRRSPLDSKSYTSSLQRRIMTTPTPPPPPPPPLHDDDDEEIELTEQKPSVGISMVEEAEQRLWSQV